MQQIQFSNIPFPPVCNPIIISQFSSQKLLFHFICYR
uniref:Uncharacterized protein n=1 Tax=Arundo donax TaxID=35708 RepID=A0A0A8Y3V0_ARUDO